MVKWYRFIEWQDIIATAVAAILWVAFTILPSNPLYIPPNDVNSDFPTTENAQVPTWLCAVIIVIVAVGTIIPAYFLAERFPQFFNRFNLFACIWCLASCEAFSGAIVGLFKNYVGRARPDIYQLCGKDVGNTPESCPNLTKKEFYDQFRSWPSGHSQTAMSGLLFLAFFVQNVVNAHRLWPSIIAALYIILGVYIGSTRIRDFRHHPDDVLAGFFIGTLISVFLWEHSKDRIFTPFAEQQVESAEVSSEKTPIYTEP